MFAHRSVSRRDGGTHCACVCEREEREKEMDFLKNKGYRWTRECVGVHDGEKLLELGSG